MQVTSPTVGYTYSRGAVLAPVAKQFRVIAVFDAGFDQYDSKLVYTDLYEAQAFGDSGDSVTGIEMKVNDIEQAREHRPRLDDRPGGRHLPHDGLGGAEPRALHRACASSKS